MMRIQGKETEAQDELTDIMIRLAPIENHAVQLNRDIVYRYGLSA